jgi:hypothetical protein
MTRPGSGGATSIAAIAAVCLLVPSRLAARLPPSPAAAELRGVEGLARAYDYILDARFDQADVELGRACGPAPREACDVLTATALWWRILLDPDSLATNSPKP